MASNLKGNLELGLRLKYYRERAGLTQAQLAELTGVSMGYIASIERGMQKLIYPERFNPMHEALGFPGWDLLEAMGYATDGSYLGIDAELAEEAKTLTREQSQALVALARQMPRQFRTERPTEASGPLQPPPRGRPRKHRTLTRPITQG